MKYTQLIVLIFSITTALQSMDKPKDKKPKKKNIIMRAVNYVQKDKSKKNLASSTNISAPPLNIETASPKFVVGQPITLLPNDILGLITHYLCTNRTNTIKETYNITRSFSLVCRALYHYYSSDTVIKQMINALAITHDKSDQDVAEIFNKQIAAKIYDLWYKAQATISFTEDDLKDTWYLNATYNGINKSPRDDTYFPYQTLLLLVVTKLDIEKIKILTDAGAPYNHDRCANPVARLAVPIYGYELTTERDKKIAIFELLFKANIHPDSRCAITLPTLLQQATQNRDKELAQILLQNGANPYTLCFNNSYKSQIDPTGHIIGYADPQFNKFKEIAKNLPLNTLYFETDNSAEPWKQNAFHMERGQPNGWLKTMYDDITKTRINLLMEQACDKVPVKT